MFLSLGNDLSWVGVSFQAIKQSKEFKIKSKPFSKAKITQGYITLTIIVNKKR